MYLSKEQDMNNLQKLEHLGQSIWYDNISRSILKKGELKKMVDDGLLGVTSNPTIFDKAISGSADYDDQIRSLVKANPRVDAAEIIQTLMVKDIQDACDVLAVAFARTKGRDGYVSIEVTPTKARDTQATIAEVRELWTKVNRKNLMVKIPATNEGLPAIEQMIYEGININVTLIFSVPRYRQVAEVYIAGLERRAKEGKQVDHVASVASVFVSRIDSLVDELLVKKNVAQHAYLAGKAAVANTKMVYQAFKEIFSGPRFVALKARRAVVQRPLWGSTGTKNPAYSDLLYVDTLIGPDTVNTVPPATYTAILDHGKPAPSVESDVAGARKILDDAAAAGIDMAWVLQKLEDDGVSAFEKSFDGLYKNLLAKRDRFAAGE
jgi:transaldolase